MSERLRIILTVLFVLIVGEFMDRTSLNVFYRMAIGISIVITLIWVIEWLIKKYKRSI